MNVTQNPEKNREASPQRGVGFGVVVLMFPLWAVAICLIWQVNPFEATGAILALLVTLVLLPIGWWVVKAVFVLIWRG